MKPDARHYNPDPGYLRELIDQVTDPELLDTHHEGGRPSQRKIAARLGVPERTFRRYLTSRQDSHQDAPYAVQFCLEVLAGGKQRRKSR